MTEDRGGGAPGVLQGESVRLVPAAESHVEALTAVLTHPEVALWWPRYDAARVRKDVLEDPEVESFAIELEGRVIGLIQCWEEKEPDYRHAGMDIGIHPDFQGRGFGTDALRTLARHLFEERGHHRLVIDPEAANERAIAVYKKIGYKPVGIMRRYSLGADGDWHDALLLDLLPEELA